MDASEYLQILVDQPLCYGLKSPDMDLYDLGFGHVDKTMEQYEGRKKVAAFILHVTCRFKVIWKTGERRVDEYYEDTPCEKFHSEVNRLVGLRVVQVGLSDKNDLWIDFDNCRIVFSTFEDGEESWRFFTADKDAPHLVVADSWLYFI